MANSWISALKAWNEKKGGSWCVPRKGSTQYEEVKRIMEGKGGIKKPKPIMESAEAKAEREARNEAVRGKALEGLRKVEEETKKRNVARKAEAEKAKPKPQVAETREDRIAKLQKNLPEETVKNIMGFVGTPTGFNLGRLFLLPKSLAGSRARAIILLLDAIARKVDIPIFLEAKADELGNIEGSLGDLEPLMKKFSTTITKDVTAFGKTVPYTRTFMTVEAPTKEQDEMLQNAFPMLKIETYRRKGSMGNKSGIMLKWKTDSQGLNLRTKAGRDELEQRTDEASEKAKKMLADLDKKGKEFYDFILEREAKGKEKEKQEREAVKEEAKKAFVIPATEAKAEFIEPERFVEVFTTFYGDKAKATTRANELKEKYPGRRIKFWGRKNLNMKLDPK